jgi:hypothetical protein
VEQKQRPSLLMFIPLPSHQVLDSPKGRNRTTKEMEIRWAGSRESCLIIFVIFSELSLKGFLDLLQRRRRRFSYPDVSIVAAASVPQPLGGLW